MAILDQPLLVDHQKYAERLSLHEAVNIRKDRRAQMHGPAVASIAVGKTVSVAPEADLYYIAKFNTHFEKGGPVRTSNTRRKLFTGFWKSTGNCRHRADDSCDLDFCGLVSPPGGLPGNHRGSEAGQSRRDARHLLLRRADSRLHVPWTEPSPAGRSG